MSKTKKQRYALIKFYRKTNVELLRWLLPAIEACT